MDEAIRSVYLHLVGTQPLPDCALCRKLLHLLRKADETHGKTLRTQVAPRLSVAGFPRIIAYLRRDQPGHFIATLLLGYYILRGQAGRQTDIRPISEAILSYFQPTLLEKPGWSSRLAGLLNSLLSAACDLINDG